MNQIKKWIISSILLAVIITACNRNSHPNTLPNVLPNTIILHWNETAYNAFGGPDYQHSLMASRINAMMHLAMHDALNGIESKYARYAFTGFDEQAHPIAAASMAAYVVLAEELPSRKSYLDSSLTKALMHVEEDESKNRGLALGKAAANAVLQKRIDDGNKCEAMVAVPPATKPGMFVGVPPFNILFAPQWENVKPFSIKVKDQFRSKPHPAIDSKDYADALNEVRLFGSINSATRSEEQTAYARFWYEFSEAGWNRIARNVIISKNLSLLESARLLALVDMAIADAYIAGWDSKMFYNFWRPYTAIREADLDNNNSTMPESTWEPVLPTPPVQDYPSTHSALGNAAATVLAKLLGDETSFSFISPTAIAGSEPRSFTSFSAAARENADSRVMAGIHFRFSCDAGLELGKKVGEWVVAHHLQPLP